MDRLGFVALLAACSTSPSPAGLEPMISVDMFNSQLRVAIGLQLKAEDVSATFRGKTIVGEPLDLGSGVNIAGEGYVLLFDVDHPVVADEPVVIDIDGIATTITAPPQFDQVQVPQTMSRSQPATISWATTSADAMQWMVESSTCVAGYGSIAPGAASVTFAPSDWHRQDGVDPNASCPTTVRLFRDRSGTLDPAFADAHGNEFGYAKFELIYDASFSSTP